MKSTTLIMIIGGLCFLGTGLFTYFSKGIKKKMRELDNVKNKEEYMNFTSKYNIILGLIGILLGALELFMPNQGNLFVIIFIVCMFVASIIQYKVSKKYRE